MNKLILVLISNTILISCYTKLKKPDCDLMNTIKKYASLDSSSKTTIMIVPKKYYFGYIKPSKILAGSFYIKNIGNTSFHIVSIKSNCDCIKTNYANTKIIYPNDSLKITYEMNIENSSGIFKNTIIVIGNCQYGNQTYYFEGSIN